jgi:hypothetical protein
MARLAFGRLSFEAHLANLPFQVTRYVLSTAVSNVITSGPEAVDLMSR